jgi:hypothetical protein
MADNGVRARPNELALRALRECHAGNIADGTARYRQALRAPGGFRLPVGLHARMLEGAGRHDAAETILRDGALASADLAVARLSDPVSASAEYEALFARGLANAHMMANYTACLSHIGASEKLAAATDPRALFRRTTLSFDGPREPYLRRIGQVLRDAEQFENTRRSIRKMGRVPRTHELAEPGLLALHDTVRGEIARYISDVAASGQMIGPWLPSAIDLHSWSVISEDAGYNVPHIHLGCWIVAVAYIAWDDAAAIGASSGGELRGGPPAGGDAACPGGPDLTVAPLPGTLVIMPAYFTHWTVPLQRPGLRISVAFNVHDGEQDERHATEIEL